MEKAIAFVVLAVICLIVGLGLVYLVSNSEANRLNAQASVEYAKGQAESMILRAQGQNSLDRAEAEAIRASAFTSKMLAMLPYTVLAVLGILGLALVAMSFAVVTKSQQNRPRVIERVIVERLPEPARRALAQQDRWQLPALIVDDSIFEELE